MITETFNRQSPYRLGLDGDYLLHFIVYSHSSTVCGAERGLGGVEYAERSCLPSHHILIGLYRALLFWRRIISILVSFIIHFVSKCFHEFDDGFAILIHHQIHQQDFDVLRCVFKTCTPQKKISKFIHISLNPWLLLTICFYNFTYEKLSYLKQCLRLIYHCCFSIP